MDRELHVIYQGMLVFVEGEDKVSAAMLVTPQKPDGTLEHVYWLITDSKAAHPLPLDGTYSLEIDGAAGAPGGRPRFGEERNVIFDRNVVALDPRKVQATIDFPRPHLITEARVCSLPGEGHFFAGADVPNDPSGLPHVHVLSYRAITGARLKKGEDVVWELEEDEPIIAFHAEEPEDLSDAGDLHMSPVRDALRKQDEAIDFHYVDAENDAKLDNLTVLGTRIDREWLLSLVEVKKPHIFAAPSPGERNPCWRYVLGN